jgi:serine/threonine-protein kinase
MTISNNKRNLNISDEFAGKHNRYFIDDDSNRLGVGGNGVVYECIDKHGNEWAIKFLFNTNKKSRARFSQEINVLLKLKHPHIIRCVDFGEVSLLDKSETIPFLIMEKADTNIVDFMRQINGNVRYDIYAPQIRGLADSLKYLHSIAIHRDIKPENILVRGETWLLSDFGLCTAIDDEKLDLTRANEKIGPKYWLSPEAIDKIYFGANEIDKSSDVYQLCAVFWFIITKRYPMGNIEEMDYAEFDRGVCQELMKSLTYSKDKRIPNGEALYERICSVTINRELKNESNCDESEKRILLPAL